MFLCSNVYGQGNNLDICSIAHVGICMCVAVCTLHALASFRMTCVCVSSDSSIQIDDAMN